MAKIAKKDVYRVTLDFSKESQGYIEGIQKQVSCKTKAEVFKQALNVFDFIIQEIANGNKLVVHGPKDKEREIVFPFIVNKKTI